jgi:hypothetical protein
MHHGWNRNVFPCSNSPFIRKAMKQMVEICSEAGCSNSRPEDTTGISCYDLTAT